MEAPDASREIPDDKVETAPAMTDASPENQNEVEMGPPLVLLDLPPDILLMLARSYFPAIPDLVHFGLTCRSLAELIFSTDLIWRERISLRWGKRALTLAENADASSSRSSPRKESRKSRIPEARVAELRRMYSSSTSSEETDYPQNSGEPTRVVSLNFTQRTLTSGESEASSSALPQQSVFKLLYAARHVADAKLEDAWAKGNFRTHTVHVLNDYVRRLMPLRGHARMLLLGTYAGQLHLVGERSEEIEVTYAGQQNETTCLDGDEDIVVGGCTGREPVRVWETCSGKTLTLLRGHSRDAIGVRIMDQKAAAVTSDSTEKEDAEDEETEDEEAVEASEDSALSSFSSRIAVKQKTPRTKIIFTASHDGTVLAHKVQISGSGGRTEAVHDPEVDSTLVYRTALHGKPTAFHLSANFVALGTSSGTLILIPGTFTCFPPRIDASHISTTTACNGPMRSLAIDERHNILALGGDDCHLRLFTLQLAPIRTFRAHNHGTVAAISLDAKRGRVATGGTDGAVKVWRIDGDGGWSVFRHTAYLGSVHLLTDRLISDGFNNVVCCHVFE